VAVGHVHALWLEGGWHELLQNHVTCAGFALGIATFIYDVPVDPLEFIVLRSSINVLMWVA
jgi:hypothetical protein